MFWSDLLLFLLAFFFFICFFSFWSLFYVRVNADIWLDDMLVFVIWYGIFACLFVFVYIKKIKLYLVNFLTMEWKRGWGRGEGGGGVGGWISHYTCKPWYGRGGWRREWWGGFTFSSALNPGNLSCKKNKPFCQK